MSRHRSLRTKVQRGVARWPVAIIGLVVLVAMGFLGWNWVGGVLERRDAAEAGGCAEGEAPLRVATTPSAADAVRDAAKAWSAERPVVYDHCIRVEVQSIDSEAVLTGLTENWDEAKLGTRPHAWITDSTIWANRLSSVDHSLLGAAPQSIATSPVLLTFPEEGAQAVQVGSGLRWTDLPDVTSATDGWDRFGKAQWGAFAVAMPDPTTNAATAMVIQSALAGASPDGRGPVTATMLTLDPVKAMMSRLVGSKPARTPGSTAEAMELLADKPSVNAAGFSAVPVFEVDLYRHNTGKDDGTPPTRPLYGVAAGGPSPIADFPFIPLAGDWVDEAQVRAAQAFREFLTEPEQRRILAGTGLRANSPEDLPKPLPGVRWSSTTDALTPADSTTTQQISAAWATEDDGQVVTVLVDSSRSTGEGADGGRSRMDWVKSALSGQVNRSVSGSIGLWEFSRSLDGDRPYRRLVATGPVRQQRQRLLDGIAGLRPQSTTQLYTSLVALYQAAQDNYQQGKRNRIVVLTDGPNDGGLTYQELRGQLERLTRTDRPVSISVVAIGQEPERRPLGEIAQSTGGTLSIAGDGAAIDPALSQLLSAD